MARCPGHQTHLAYPCEVFPSPCNTPGNLGPLAPPALPSPLQWSQHSWLAVSAKGREKDLDVASTDIYNSWDVKLLHIYTNKGERARARACVRVCNAHKHLLLGRLFNTPPAWPVLPYPMFGVQGTLRTGAAQCSATQCQHHSTLCMLNIHRTFSGCWYCVDM